MAIAHIRSVAFVGIDAVFVDVEVDVTRPKEGKPSISIIGLPDAAVREAKERVVPAIRNAGFSPGEWEITVNLAPGDLRKEGALYDLPIALGVLIATETIKPKTAVEYLIAGELGLTGELRPIRGALAMAILAKENSLPGVLLPKENSEETEAIPGITTLAPSSLAEACQILETPPSSKNTPSVTFKKETLKPQIDFSDVKGQLQAKRALEIAAAGNHNVLFVGPPGSGKTMLAKALAGIMPSATLEEALEITKIASISKHNEKLKGLIHRRPFRAPHHTTSYVGLIGGGTVPQPGEVSLAHNGVLFLDELPEFSRTVLEVLRQPLEDGYVNISRSRGRTTFPSSFVLIAAMNPCPCGFLGHPDKHCSCSGAMIDRYRNKISGPLLDRIDMQLEVPALRYADLSCSKKSENSLSVRNRVEMSRKRQHARFGKSRPNSTMSSSELREFAALTPQSLDLMQHAIDVMGISVRAHDRILKVARTIADLEFSEHISEEHLMEAIGYRSIVKETILN